MKKIKISPFAAHLRYVMDGPKGFSRQEWAGLLNVTQSAISQWLQDQTLPRPVTLRALFEIAGRYCDKETVAQFRELAAKPSIRVSPLGRRMAPTVGHYLVEPIRESFLALLDGLEPIEQETVLLEASEACHELRERREDGRVLSEPALKPQLVSVQPFAIASPSQLGAVRGIIRPNREVAALPANDGYAMGVA